MPHLITREAAVTVLVLAVILVISMLFNAPLAEQANPGLSPNPTKAPWYFMGLQELLMHFHPLFAVLVIPLFTVAAVFALPWIDSSGETAGVWFRSAKGRRSALAAAIAGSILTVAAILADEFWVKTGTVSAPDLIHNGVLPFIIVLLALALLLFVIERIFSASRGELVQAFFTLVLASFLVLTATGIWFRGAGMQLGWAGG